MKVFLRLNSKQKRGLKTYCSKIGITLDIRKFEGIIFVLKSGRQWRLLPSRFGKWKSVYHYFRRICDCQWFNRMLKHLLLERRKRIKGIKRHIAVDSDGLPLAVAVTTANGHDSKGAYLLIANLSAQYRYIKSMKADNGYKGKLTEIAKEILSIEMQCVKSNYGTSEFIPLEGRWVVERTISWLDNFRRLCRNYEQLLSTAASMVRMAFLMILIEHI